MSVTPLRVLYIASPSFSGSTLLSLILDVHPQIVSVGEVTGPIDAETAERYPCSCGLPIAACPFWLKLQAEMESHGIPFSPRHFEMSFLAGDSLRSRLRFRSLRSVTLNRIRDTLVGAWPAHRRAEARLLARNRGFFEAALAVTGKDVFCDATKDPIRIRHLSRIPGIDLRVIHLVRDPRATANSFRKNTGLAVQTGAGIWRRVHREIRQIAEWRSVPVLRIAYENLCQDPQSTFRRIAAFADVEECSFAPPATPQHVIGNRMRLAGSGNIRLDESWRSDLSDVEQREILVLAGSFARRMGYFSEP